MFGLGPIELLAFIIPLALVVSIIIVVNRFITAYIERTKVLKKN